LKKELEEIQKSSDKILSQDDVFWYMHLTSRLEKFESFKVVEHLRSAEARKENSLTRTFIESAVDFFGSLNEEDLPRVLHAAIILGEKTLSKFQSALPTLDKKLMSKISLKLASLL